MTKGGAARSRDPRALMRRRRELDVSINAQVTGRKRHSGWVDEQTWLIHARTALDKGGRITRLGTIEWNVAGRCENPVFRTIRGLQADLWGRAVRRSNHDTARYLDMWVPCRRCSPCLAKKAAHWRHRAEAEIALTAMVGSRTWFVTLTFNPHHRALIYMRAQSRLTDQGWASLSREQQGSRLVNAASKYLTDYLKRVRSQSGAALRYLAVWELHKDGTPHAHLLIHEGAPDKPVRHAVLSRQWWHGFSNAKLVEADERAAHYAAKYLAKSPLTRVRASVGYGHYPGGQSRS